MDPLEYNCKYAAFLLHCGGCDIQSLDFIFIQVIYPDSGLQAASKHPTQTDLKNPNWNLLVHVTEIPGGSACSGCLDNEKSLHLLVLLAFYWLDSQAGSSFFGIKWLPVTAVLHSVRLATRERQHLFCFL